MSTMTSLARALADETKTAQGICSVRHFHVTAKPMVLVPLVLAGEHLAPLAAMVGSDPAHPRLLVTRRPRVPTDRLQFAEELAAELLLPFAECGALVETVQPSRRGAEPKSRATDAPQLWVPNTNGVEFVRLLGRMTRFRQTNGPWAVPPNVPRLGVWCTWLGEQAEYADSSVLVAATRALSGMWVTGQSSVEDGNLAALMGWIAPPRGLTAPEAALRAEDPIMCPPAGPTTDPQFDQLVLAPALRDLQKAGSDAVREQILARLTRALREQIQPTWDLVWQAIGLLRAVPAGGHVESRWERERQRFTDFAVYVNGGGRPQKKRDDAVRSAQGLHSLEQRLSEFEAQRAFDDPLVMAEYRLSGEAFHGVIVEAQPNRVIPGPRKRLLRPQIKLITHDDLQLVAGDKGLHDPRRKAQEATIVNVETGPLGTEVTLELSGGMGGGLTAPPGSVPSVGEAVTYAKLSDAPMRSGTFPSRADTPWTHGGPPQEYVPVAGDATEDWS